jgi:hypothetical protein
MARKPLIINVVQIETAELGLEFGEQPARDSFDVNLLRLG